MLYINHQKEFKASAIAPALAELNFHSTNDNSFIREWLNWRPRQKWRTCPFRSGWYCSTVDPRSGELRNWGPFKPDIPRLDTKGKPRKYEHPGDYPTLPIFLQVDQKTWAKIAQRYGVSCAHSYSDNNSPHFWEWVWMHNLPIIICEGAKKAAALLSAGHIAIALPGVWNGRRKGKGNAPERLVSDLDRFATSGRTIYFCFDNDSKLKTRLNVSNALIRTGKLFGKAGCPVNVICLPGLEKGVDDFIVARGAEAFEHLYLDAISLETYELERRSWKNGHCLTYAVGLDLNCRYLMDGIQAAFGGSEKTAIEGLMEFLKKGTDLQKNSNLRSVLGENSTTPEFAGVIVIRSDMGTGKTEMLARIKETYPNARILNLGHRVALLRNLSNRIGTAIYSDCGYGMWEEQWLSITADSLYKLKTEGNVYDFVFLDEVEQFIDHVLRSDTCRKHRHVILQSLKYFVRSAKCIVLSDAHLSDISIQFILAMRAEPAEQPFVIHNRYCNGDRQVYWHEGKDQSGIVQAMTKALFEGQKIVVACDGRKLSEDLHTTLSQLFPERKIACINAGNSSEAWAKALIENINKEATEFDCLIYSPSINTGVSIDVEHFDQVFGVFVGGSLAATDCLQALNRYRPKVEWHVWVNSKPVGGYKPTNAERIKLNKLQENELGGFLLNIVPETGVRTVQDEFAWNAWASLTARRNESLNNLHKDVMSLLKRQRHTLVLVEESVDAATKIELEAARSINKEARKQGILNADRISDAEARRLQRKERPTIDDFYKLERHRIESSWNKEISPELIDQDQGGRTIRQFSVLKSLLEPQAEEKLINARLVPLPPDVVAQRDRTEREKFHVLDLHNYSVAWFIRAELGLPKLIDPEREFCNHDLDLIELQEKAQRYSRQIKEFLGITILENATPIQIFRQLLGQAGLKLEYIRREGKRGEQVRLYRLSPSQWQMAQEVLEFWRSKREGGAKQSIQRAEGLVVTGGNLYTDPNKRGVVTTDENPALSPDGIKDALDLLGSAIALQDKNVLRVIWDCLNNGQKRHLWAVMADSYRSAIQNLLGESDSSFVPSSSGELVSGSVVQWIGQIGTWVVDAISFASARIFRLDQPDTRCTVALKELKWVGQT